MITIPPAKRASKRTKVRPAAVQVPLTLVAAYFDPDGPITYLTFDRTVDVSAAVASEFAVADGPDNGQFIGITVGAGGDPAQIAVTMNRTGGYSGSDQLLTASGSNGITAIDDGGTWAGVMGLALPYPPPPPVGPPQLQSATWDNVMGFLVLQFDRPIDVSGIRTWDFTIVDDTTAQTYAGYSSAEMVGPNGVKVTFSGAGPYDGEGVMLTATNDNGIVAVDGGQAWGGVTDQTLPPG